MPCSRHAGSDKCYSRRSRSNAANGQRSTRNNKVKYTNSDLENLDVADPEIDEIAKSLSLDPQIRADIQIPTRGKQVLQDQENYLMAHICEKIGLGKDYWDAEAKKTSKWTKGIEIESDIKEGKTEAHEFVLSRIREKFKEKFLNKV